MKRFLILCSCVMMLFLTGCGNKITTYEEINYSEYSNLIEAQEDFILYLGSSNCSHCASFKPTLEKIIEEHQLDVKYIDVFTLSEKEYAVLQNKTKLQGTPTVVFVEDGVVQTSPKIVGAVEYSVALEKFKESGYVK